MARTLSEIYNQIITEKELLTSLNGLTPNNDNAANLLTDINTRSKVAVWRTMFWAMAFAIWTHENLFDKYKIEIENASNKIVAGSIGWWVATAKYFQYGDKLQYIDNKFKYALEDESKKIIYNCAVKSQLGAVYILVCKQDTNLDLIPLNSSELEALNLYVSDMHPLGTNYVIVNDNADLLNISLNVKIDASLLYYSLSDPNDYTGSSLDNIGVTYPITDTINNYIHQLDNYNFGGVFQLNKLIANILNTSGVIDAKCYLCEAKKHAGTFADLLGSDLQEYQTTSGYLNINSLIINYIV